MGRGLSSFLAGFGTGYINQSNREQDRARQEKLDQIQFDRAAREDADYRKKQADDAAIRAAAAPAQVVEGAGGAVRPDFMDNSDVGLPENADLPNGGLMQGGFRVGNTGYQDQASAQGAAEKYNAPDATNQRLIAAVRGIDPVRALEMDSRIQQNKLTGMQVKKAEQDEADTKFNANVLQNFQQHGPWAGAEKILTETNAGGLAGQTVKHRVSDDGKYVRYVSTDKDGKETDMGLNYENNPQGVQRLLYDSSRLDPKTKIEWYKDWTKQQADIEQKQKELARLEKKDASDAKIHEANLALSRAQLGISQAASRRAEEDHAAGMPERQLKSTLATLQLGLANTNDPTERQAISDKITAIQSGLGGSKDNPSEVKLAAAILRSGLATTYADALQMAISKKSQSPEEMHKEFVAAGIKNMSSPADAVKNADEVMGSMGYGKKGGRWGLPNNQVPAKGLASDPKAIAIRDDKSLSLDEKRAKLKELGYQ